MYQIFYIRLSVLSYTLMIDGYSTKSGDTHISLSLEASIPSICCLELTNAPLLLGALPHHPCRHVMARCDREGVYFHVH